MSVCHISQHSHWDTQASFRQSSLSILAILKKHADGIYFWGFFVTRLFLGDESYSSSRYQIYDFPQNVPTEKCNLHMLTLSVLLESEREIKRTAESEKERVTGRKAIQHKGLWRSLTFLYVRIESLYMVLPGTLPIHDRSIRVLTIVCISSNNSLERQEKYIQSNQPFAKAPQKHTFQQHSVI